LDENNDEHMRNGTMKKKDEHHINEEKKHGSIPCKKNIPARDPKQSGGVGG